MGELIVEIESYDRIPHTLTVVTNQDIIWKRSGNHGNRWKLAVIRIDTDGLFTVRDNNSWNI
jgi:hypothetical protein